MTYFKKPTQEQPHQPVFQAPVLDDEYDEEDAPLTYEEEQELIRRDRWRMASGVADLFGVLAGILMILLLVALLISLVNWVAADMTQSFTLLQAWF